MLASAKQEDLDQQNKASMDLQRRAFLEGDWDAYVTTLHTQASMYAHLQIPFAAWYDLTRPVEQMLLGALVEAYAKEPARLTAALSVMSAFFDQVMAVMAERYIEAREEDRFRRLVDAVEDYSILMLDAEGRVSSWNGGSASDQGMGGARGRRKAHRGLLSGGAPRDEAARGPRGGDPRRQAHGGRLAGAQGRLEILGERGPDADQGGHGGRARLREGDPGPHGATAQRGGLARE